MPLQSFQLSDIVNYINKLEKRIDEFEDTQAELARLIADLNTVSVNGTIALVRADSALTELNNATVTSLANKGSKLKDVLSVIKEAVQELGGEIEEPAAPAPVIPELPQAKVSGEQVLVLEYDVPYTHLKSIDHHNLQNADNSIAHFFTTLQLLNGETTISAPHTILKNRDVNNNLQSTNDEYYYKLREAFTTNVAYIMESLDVGLNKAAQLAADSSMDYSNFVQGMVANPIIRVATYTRVTSEHAMYENHFKNHTLKLLESNGTRHEHPIRRAYWLDIDNPSSMVEI